MTKMVTSQVRRRLALREHLGTFRQLTVQRVCNRSALAGLFGRRTSNRMLGIHGPTAKANDPVLLLRHAHMAAGRLASPDFVPANSPEAADAVPLEHWRRSWRESLERGHDRLEEVCRELAHHADNRSTLREKSLEMRLHRDDLSAIAHLQEGLLMLGMERDLARKVWQNQRPMGRPARRKAQKGTQAESPAGEQKVSSREVG
jgi:hypothetical protein